MAHMVNGKIATIRPSWHGLDNILTQEESRDTEIVIRKGGLDFNVEKIPSQYEFFGEMRHYPGDFILVNSKSGLPLGHVSKQWKTPQPRECVEFFQDLVEHFGWYIESAGSLKQGALYWCLANNGLTGTVGKNDHMQSRVYIATGYGMPTIVDHTGVFIVCWNTLSMAVRNTNAIKTASRTTHRSVFDSEAVKKQLGIISYEEEKKSLLEIANEAAKVKVSDEWARNYFAKIVSNKDHPFDENGEILNPRVVKKLDGFWHDSPGSNLPEREGTMWGAINAVTYWTDHVRGHTEESRGVNQFYGNSRAVKKRAIDRAASELRILQAA